MTTDRASIDRFKHRIDEEWRDPRVTDGYRMWDRHESEWGRAASDVIIDRAKLAPDLNVLDIGSAHGEPGLAIAERVGPQGSVTLTDIAPALLAIADERARAAGLLNVRVQQADAHELPFHADSFDRVTCRFAAMYFADVAAAFREARRVLKPGGAAVYLTWAGFDQPMFRDVVGALFQYVQPPEDEPGAPSPFRFAEPGALTRALQEAGFVEVEEVNTTVGTTFAGGPDRWWEWFTAMAVPLQPLIASLTPPDKEKAMAEIYAALRPYYDGEAVRVPIDVIVASGRKAT